MGSSGLAKTAKTRFGVEADCVAWCRISRIPDPPAEVRKAAGGAPVRPAFIRPLGMLGLALAAVLWPVLVLLGLLASLEDFAEWLLSSKERARARARARDAEERKKAIKAHSLDQLFDGDWTAAAGQLLLRWYGHSSHPKRLLALTPDRIVLAAPPSGCPSGRQSAWSSLPKFQCRKPGWRIRFSASTPVTGSASCSPTARG